MRIFKTFVIALLVTLSACAAPAPTWRSAVDIVHPLVGKIIDAKTGEYVSDAAAARRLHGARYLLLGEKHDNPDHHLIQARLLEIFTDAGLRPAVAWEMISEDQTLALAAFQRAAPPDGSLMGEALRWRDFGWPDWTIYQPIADAAIAAKLPMAAASPGRRASRAQSARFASPLPQPLLDGLKAELVASHCGQLPGAAVAPMAQAQQRKDLAMAESLLANATRDGAVLIAGNGHVRRDRGAPWWLTQLGEPPTSILAVGILEVDREKRTAIDLKAYADQFDLIYMTPKIDSEDACEKFAEQLRRLRNKS